MSLIDEAIAELHSISAVLKNEAHHLAGPVENVLVKLGDGLAEAGTVVTTVGGAVEAADPAVAPLVRDVHAIVQAAQTGDEVAQRAVAKIADATKEAQDAKAAAAATTATPEPGATEPASPTGENPSTPPTGDGSAAPSPGETGAVAPQDTPPAETVQ